MSHCCCGVLSQHTTNTLTNRTQPHTPSKMSTSSFSETQVKPHSCPQAQTTLSLEEARLPTTSCRTDAPQLTTPYDVTTTKPWHKTPNTPSHGIATTHQTCHNSTRDPPPPANRSAAIHCTRDPPQCPSARTLMTSLRYACQDSSAMNAANAQQCLPM
jgi:hypothetical protein